MTSVPIAGLVIMSALVLAIAVLYERSTLEFTGMWALITVTMVGALVFVTFGTICVTWRFHRGDRVRLIAPAGPFGGIVDQHNQG